MKKTELTKEQQKEFSWLVDANTLYEDVEVIEVKVTQEEY